MYMPQKELLGKIQTAVKSIANVTIPMAVLRSFNKRDRWKFFYTLGDGKIPRELREYIKNPQSLQPQPPLPETPPPQYSRKKKWHEPPPNSWWLDD